ncbi:coxsackievirus and adenovirus receptor homolog isoform X2 [Sander lucioperca]|uniref:coxsackievirus and adenovirus receptor homolog isoform X2 n=1 Tax=Sander lucioperca TaxID=283035 RepID=UPI0016538C69|nr:coxsackievirus and adenovirus receptor homolog isoform X2 [Sander lucioperca]
MTGYTLSALMAPLILLLVLLSEAASDVIVVTVDPGDDVILPCQSADPSISAVEWTRPDQHPSFKDRVELVDRELKDGDVSLTLKNVSSIDNGTYECRVKPDGSRRRKRAIIDSEPIRTIRLQVTEPDLIELTVYPGDDVILPCRADDSSIRAAEWTRPDLEEPEYVLLYRDGHLDPTYQHPSFKDRVELVDRDLKDGDVSLILKNVSSIDNGTYECRVASGGSRRKKRGIIDSEPIRIIRLQVTEPGSEDGNSSPGGRYHGLAAGVAGGLLLLTVAVLIYKRHKDMRSSARITWEPEGAELP